ncbi:capsular biosynthesis protein [Kordiimonas sp. SCSIO 12610]|uniref:capsular biosynthesis protein n=1 Tax=Kordiimonas sp. SCSIO 12610 TaxID=2829597 RepID=UPI00210BEB99|nr:capsular biosynthesis protein [Kordiimonas sp. SCSIO 12610]UTW56250.1 capsular biosynthesis protein [Kordiimonas sp. SCSIO 12610]
MLLQGPIGPFFAYMAEAITHAGANSFKINLNKGDAFFSTVGQSDEYHGTPAGWRDFLSRFVREHRIDAIIVYGDQRFYHRAAREIASLHDIRYFAFEEGYVRPGYVTFEEFGNNANSRFPTWFNDAYERGELGRAEIPAPLMAGYTFGGQIWNAIAYYVVKDWKFFGFKSVQHHRPGNWFTEMNAWILTWFRKQVTKRSEKGFVEKLVALKKQEKTPLYFVPLQVAVDSQILYHSRFDGMKDFLREVFISFAEYAPKDAILVLKHHPMDRGYNHYGDFVRKLVSEFSLNGRVHYVFDVDLYDLFKITDGCVTVNSTVGLIALKENVPTIAIGKAMYVDAGLTYSGNLDEFWQNSGSVNHDKLAVFEDFLKEETLIPGSFYGQRTETATAAVEKLARLLMV